MTKHPEAVVRVWKPAAMLAFQAAFVTILLDRGRATTDDVPDHERPAPSDRQSVPGNALRDLRHANVIAYADDIHNPADGIFHGRRISKRPDAKGREVRYYRLVNRGIAEAWLRRNAIPVPADGQLRMAL